MGKQYKSFLTPVDELPLFVKGGAIIPMQKVVQYIGEQSIGELILQVYPGGNSSLTGMTMTGRLWIINGVSTL